MLWVSEKGHTYKVCVQRLSCKICCKKHPIVLHRNSTGNFSKNGGNNFSHENYKNAKSFCTNEVSENETGAGDFNKILCPVVPVRILVDETNNWVTTYATFDACSTSCFMNENFLLEL